MVIPNRGPSITITTIVFLALSWIVVVTRYYVRIFITKNFSLDDWLTGLCLVRLSGKFPFLLLLMVRK